MTPILRFHIHDRASFSWNSNLFFDLNDSVIDDWIPFSLSFSSCSILFPWQAFMDYGTFKEFLMKTKMVRFQHNKQYKLNI